MGRRYSTRRGRFQLMQPGWLSMAAYRQSAATRRTPRGLPAACAEKAFASRPTLATAQPFPDMSTLVSWMLG